MYWKTKSDWRQNFVLTIIGLSQSYSYKPHTSHHHHRAELCFYVRSHFAAQAWFSLLFQVSAVRTGIEPPRTAVPTSVLAAALTYGSMCSVSKEPVTRVTMDNIFLILDFHYVIFNVSVFLYFSVSFFGFCLLRLSVSRRTAVARWPLRASDRMSLWYPIRQRDAGVPPWRGVYCGL